MPVYAGCEFESHPRRLKKPVHLNRFFCYTSHDLKLYLETLGFVQAEMSFHAGVYEPDDTDVLFRS